MSESNAQLRTIRIEFMDGKIENYLTEYCNWNDKMMTVVPTDETPMLYIPFVNVRKFTIIGVT